MYRNVRPSIGAAIRGPTVISRTAINTLKDRHSNKAIKNGKVEFSHLSRDFYFQMTRGEATNDHPRSV
jgi:hypothetical protein